MITISDISQCCGCTACVTVCPVQAVVMRRDPEGFYYPVANPDICIGCGRCDKVCPMPALGHSDILETVSAHHEDLSGKVEAFISEGGAVFGPVQESDGHIGYCEISDVASADRLLYDCVVQCDPYAVYEDVSLCLNEGQKVMFIGTPCMMAGLESCLPDVKDVEEVSLSCTGVSSPGLWDKYCSAYRADAIKDDVYRVLHEQNMTVRPSCRGCRFNNGSSSYPEQEKRESLFRGYNSMADILQVMKSHVRHQSLSCRLRALLSTIFS